MKILHTADWHFDISNLDFTTAAVHRAVGLVGPMDVAVIAGDLAVHRGSINPHVAYEIRRAVQRVADGTHGGALVLTGNHDQSFHVGRVGTARGLLHRDGSMQVETAEAPRIVVRQDADGCTVAFVLVPTPNKYWLRAAGLEDGRDAQAAVEAAIRGLILEARTAKADRVVVVYHGTVSGCMAGDERVMVTGMDVAVGRACFAGADAVMLGHIHKRQDWPATDTLPAMVYCGAVAPLTWNDKAMDPAVYVWTITREAVTYEAVQLPVESQMVDLAIDVPESQTAQDALQGALFNCPAVHAGARVRVRLRGPKAVLDTVTRRKEQELQAEFKLRDLNVVPEPSDDGLVRLELGAGWTMENALARYMEFQETPATLRAGVMEFARDIERQVADAHLDARFDFRPRRIEGVNWCQYAGFDVDLTQAGVVVAVAGANYSGKSNFARALAFAVYKQQLAGNRLAALVRKGQRDAYVAVEFDSNGATYRVRRTLKVDAQGAASSDVDFLRLDGISWVPVNEGTAAKTQAAIEALVGPWEYFEATTWAGQNAIDKVLDLTPAGMKDRLMTLLHRNFDDRARLAAAAQSAAAAERERIEARQAAETRVLEKYAGLEDPQDAQNLVDVLTGNLEQLAGEIVKAQERVDACWNRASEMRAAQQSIRTAEQAERQAKTKRDQAADAAGGADDLRARIAELEQLLADTAGSDFAQAMEEVERLRQVRDAVAGDQAALRAEAGAAAAAVQALVTDATQKIGVVERSMDAAKRELAQARKAAELRKSVPCRGETLVASEGDGSLREVVTSGCRFLLDAIAAEKAVPTLADRVTELDERMNELVGQRNNALGLQRQTAQANQEKAEQLDVKRADADAALAAAEAVLRAAATGQAQRQAQERLLADARTSLAVAEIAAQAAAQAAEDHRQAVSALLAAREAGAGADEAERDLKAATEDAAALRAQESGARTRLSQAEAKVAELKAAAGFVEASREEIKRLNEQSAQLAGVEAVASHYRQAMHRDGLPFLLLESFAIPALQRLANEYLADTSFSVQVTSERELASGEVRNAVNVTFTDHRGTHHVSSASGFQRTAIGMAFMAAQADLSAEATGSRVWFAVQDEGFGTMDPENLEGAKRTIRRIGAARGHFLFISHVPGMTEAADSVLTVTDQGGTSYITVDR